MLVEMDKPQDNIFNVSSYKIKKKELKVLNLTLDQALINGQAINVLICDKDKREKILNY